MARMPSKSFRCDVVTETVTIALQRRIALGGTKGKLFVRCSERDCQYVDANEPPCPLTLALFTNAIRERMIADRRADLAEQVRRGVAWTVESGAPLVFLINGEDLE